MTVLITGVAGFIGSHLAEALIKKGQQVIGIDNFSTGREENISEIKNHSSFRFIKGDVSNATLLDELICSSDAIYHLAASVGVKLLTKEPVISIQNNVDGILTILKLADRYKRKIFFASSSEVYGKADSRSLEEKEDLTLGPPTVSRWGYGCTKALAEYLALSYYKQYGLPVVIGRFFNVCGPRQTGAYGMVIPRFVVSALKGEPITVFGDGTQTRSFTYITDAIQAILTLMDTPEAIGEVFNIGNPRHISILELAQMIKDLTGSNSPITHISYQEAYGSGFEDMYYRVPDISKMKKVTGFEPKVLLEKMLKYIIDYWKVELKTRYR